MSDLPTTGDPIAIMQGALDEIQELRSQVQTLMDAIQDHNEIAYCDSRGLLQTALAKVKEGK